MPLLATLLHHCSTHKHQLLFLHIPLPSTIASTSNTTASQLVTTPSAGQGGTLTSSHTASEGHVYSNMNCSLQSPSPSPSLHHVVPANSPPSICTVPSPASSTNRGIEALMLHTHAPHIAFKVLMSHHMKYSSPLTSVTPLPPTQPHVLVIGQMLYVIGGPA